MSRPGTMTKIEGTPDSVVPGMAFFPGTGPALTTCYTCKFHGYYREHGVTGTRYKHFGCKKFFELAGVHGPVVPDDSKACKYYEKVK